MQLLWPAVAFLASLPLPAAAKCHRANPSLITSGAPGLAIDGQTPTKTSSLVSSPSVSTHATSSIVSPSSVSGYATSSLALAAASASPSISGSSFSGSRSSGSLSPSESSPISSSLISISSQDEATPTSQSGSTTSLTVNSDTLASSGSSSSSDSASSSLSLSSSFSETSSGTESSATGTQTYSSAVSSGSASTTESSDQATVTTSSTSITVSDTSSGATETSSQAVSTSSMLASSTEFSESTASSDSATITDSSTGATTTVFPTDAVGTTSEFDGPITLEAAPTVTLMPAPPYGLDQGSLDVVTPADTNALWYTSPANESAEITATIMRLNLTYLYSSIALDQSIYIESVICSGSTITITFNETEIFSYIKPIWQSYSQILFITAATSCSADGQNVFFLTGGSPVCQEAMSTCTATGSFEELADVYSEMGADWGAIDVEDSTATTTTTSSSACSSPPASEISGLPAASCGSDFDSLLDSKLGFYSGDDSDIDSVMALIAPGTQTKLSPRGFWSSLKKAVSSVKAAVKSVAKTVATAVVKVAAKVVTSAAKYVVSAAKSIAKTVVTIAKTVYNVVKFLVTGDYNQTFNMNMNVAPPDSLLVKSPWDDQLGFKFYHFAVDPKDSGYSLWDNAIDLITDELGANAKAEPGVDYWCINCGIKGNIQATGTLKANLGGIKNAELKINGNLYAGLFVGVDAFATIKKKNTKTLFKRGLPALTIPKIFVLGPSVSLGVSAEARIELIGRALAGASLNWEKINGTINFLDKTKTVTSGFTPVLNGTLQTTKKSKIILSLGLPVAIEFGLDLLDGTWKKEASLTETPSLQAVLDYEETVKISGTTENGGCGSVDTTPSTKCYGVYWNITAVNDVELNLFDVVDYNLFHWESKVIAQGCVGTWADNSSSIDTCSSDNSTSSTSSVATITATTIQTSPMATTAAQITTSSTVLKANLTTSTAVTSTTVTSTTVTSTTVTSTTVTSTTVTSTTAACTSSQGMKWAYYNASAVSSVEAVSTMAPLATGLAQNGIGNFYANEGSTLTYIEGSSTSLSSIRFILDYVGYIYATTSGTYTFYAWGVDDEFYMWWGSQAYSGWNSTNYNIDQKLYAGYKTATITLTKGTYLPLRILYRQDTGPGYFNINLYDPNGNDLLSIEDTSAGKQAIFTNTCDGQAPAFQSWGSES
ncbi:hypothetical protein PFICI_01619 [Pestalotiopsis fici W106-1]|uniref:PA14 domain-containing protein n=1 Tax=Pestalotiopsis fici (strain W106-1 / CGMCC3.15140) TaxID=1229662 RepID=W3XRF7_PESFW|nr:uncharacterized protein PFICI_01619 [Pestalotiopsis fici W106-1]ETS87791.1 hypothetical protein PFICI_01619 [Pestalotiopsis fici W106-1]